MIAAVSNLAYQFPCYIGGGGGGGGDEGEWVVLGEHQTLIKMRDNFAKFIASTKVCTWFDYFTIN